MSPRSRAIRGWLPHAAVAAAAAVQLALAAAWHHDDEELAARIENGPPRQIVHALHVLTNRGPSPDTNLPWSRAYVTGLMNHPEPLVADFAYTVDVCRMKRPVWQENRLSQRVNAADVGEGPRGETFEEWLRHFLLYRRKVAGRHMGAMLRLKNDELRWLLDAIAGRRVDAPTVLAAILQRQTEANQHRTTRMAPPNPGRRRARASDDDEEY